jgi:hypothetical protein
MRKIFNLNNMTPNNVRLVDPYLTHPLKLESKLGSSAWKGLIGPVLLHNQRHRKVAHACDVWEHGSCWCSRLG